MGNYLARRLFQKRPEEVLEHPDDLPTDTNKIPEGPIENWMAFAPRLTGDPSQITGPFQPCVTKPYDDGQPCIESSDGTQFWFGTIPSVPCWYQSGYTLRFMRGTLPIGQNKPEHGE